MNVLIGGDFAPGKVMTSMIEEGNYSFIEDLKSLTETSDFSIINLESPFKIDSDLPIDKYGPNIGCTPKTVNALRYANIDAVTLANNHVLDYGENALKRTVDICKENGIKTVGVGRNLKGASLPLIIEKEDETVAVVNCCEHEFSIATEDTAGANPLDPISQYYQIRELKEKYDYVLVIVHGGHEMFNLPSPRMQKTYRFFIDAGADAVVNHHQHCFSGYEIYNSKPIFYGLGNLCFDESKRNSQAWYYGYMISLEFSDKINFKIHPYEQFKTDSSLKLINIEKIGSEIKHLNSVIQNIDTLTQHANAYYETCSKHIPSVFDIYNNSILRKLRYRRLLPSTITKKSRLRIHDHILCESHLDKIKFYFIKKMKNKL